MDKRLGNKEQPPRVCAKTGKGLSHNEAGAKIKLSNGYFCFVRAAHGSLTDAQRAELMALVPKVPAPKIAQKKEVS